MSGTEWTLCRKLRNLDEAYKRNTNLRDNVETARRYYEGRQFPEASDPDMPRVVLNICQKEASAKAGKVAGTPIYLRFFSNDRDLDCDALRRFDEYVRISLGEELLDFDAALSAYVDGTAVTYYRWDPGIPQRGGEFAGGLAEELVDPLRFAVANPAMKSLQDQEWVMVWAGEDARAACDLCEGKTRKEEREKREAVMAEARKPRSSEGEAEGANQLLVTVYTRYFRIGGEVYFECETDTVRLFSCPHPLNPKASRKAAEDAVAEREEAEEGKGEYPGFRRPVPDAGADAEASSLPDADPRRGGEKARFGLYPFASFVPVSVRGSFYGRSDIGSLISVQNAVNFAASMNMKSMQDMAYSKVLVKPQALKGQQVTNEPGQVIVDHTPGSAWGIGQMSPASMPADVFAVSTQIEMQAERIYGFSDLETGTSSASGQSGYAIQQLLAQSNAMILHQQKAFWQYCREKALVRLRFYRFYVGKSEFGVPLQPEEYEGRVDGAKWLKEQQAKALREGRTLDVLPGGDREFPVNRAGTVTFEGKSLGGMEVQVEVLQGTADSKLAESQLFDSLILNGGIDSLKPEMLELYLSINPNVSEATKTRLEGAIKRLKQSEVADLRAQIAQLQSELAQAKSAGDGLSSALRFYKDYAGNLDAQFAQRLKALGDENASLRKLVGEADGIISGSAYGNKAAARKTTEGEGKSLNARGVSGSDIV